MAFYSPMMYAKRNSWLKFQQNRCEFCPPHHAFYDFGLAGLKKTIFNIYKKNLNCPRALQVGSFCGELRGEQTL